MAVINHDLTQERQVFVYGEAINNAKHRWSGQFFFCVEWLKDFELDNVSDPCDGDGYGEPGFFAVDIGEKTYGAIDLND